MNILKFDRRLTRFQLILVLCLLVFLGCKKNVEHFPYRFNIKNNTGVNVFAINTVTLESYQINQRDSSIILSNEKIDNFKIEPTSSTTMRFLLEHRNEENYSINGYEYDLEYRFSGNAEEVDGSYLNDLGQEVFFTKTKLPFAISYKYFNGKKYNVDARNLQEKTYVTVEVFFKGKLLRQVSSPVSAGASGNINGGSF